MYYSKSTNGFYSKQIHGDKAPSDCVEISAEYHAELLNGQTSGKVITPDNKGYPRLIDPPAPTEEELRLLKNRAARSYLASTDWYVTRKVETGADIPEEVLRKRAESRASVVE